jgi:AmmeMemoRadiSam system protein B
MFYPADPVQLREEIRRFLDQAQNEETPPKALIAPHAGYIYSGPIAASAYAALASAADTIKKVVLLGPAHSIPFAGLAAPTSNGFITPLGMVPVDQEAINRLLLLPQVVSLDAAHDQEHSLEVHLPFLQMVLKKFEIIPLVVGDAGQKEVAEVLELLWNGEETLIVISTDLSHYNSYEIAQQMDRSTSLAIERLQPEQIHYDMACGRNPVNGLLAVAKQKGLQAKTLDLRNSGDTAGPRDRVVGYGAYVFH